MMVQSAASGGWSYAECLERIDACVSRVVPDDPALISWTENYGRVHRHRLAEDLMLVGRFAAPGARVLEFGASPPFLSLALAEAGYAYCGLDIAPERFAGVLSAHRLDVRRVDFETEAVPLEDAGFDLVLFNEIFEHLRIDLIATLVEVRRVLKPSGVMLLSTPNARSLRGLWSLLRHHRGCHAASGVYDEYEKLRLYGHMGHVREYTAREVSDLLGRIGLAVRETIFRLPSPSAAARRRPGLALAAAVERAICGVVPSLRPLFTLVCVRADLPPDMANGGTR
jgi:SAM-dependent methyltransferase